MMTKPSTYKTPHLLAVEEAQAKNADVLRVLESAKKAMTPSEIAWAVSKNGRGWCIRQHPNFAQGVTDASLAEQAAPAGFYIGKECELKSADETQAVVRYARHPLLTEEVLAHIATGKQPTSLALDWDGRVSFVLTDSMQLKKVVFADSVLEQSNAQGQRADDFDGNVLMLTAEIGLMLDDLIAELDGVAK